MRKLSSTLLFLILSLTMVAQKQWATVHIPAHADEEINARFNSTQFNFDGRVFTGADTGFRKIEVSNDLMYVITISDQDTLSFFTRILKDSLYILKPNQGTAAFRFSPVRFQRLGSLYYFNYSSKDRMVYVDPLQSELIRSKEEYKLNLSDSVCKSGVPVTFLLSKPNYLNQDVRVTEKEKLSFRLFLPSNKAELMKVNYLFLYGEEITLNYKEALKTYDISVTGYLPE